MSLVSERANDNQEKILPFNLTTMSYNLEDAKKYGVIAATILYNIRFWIKNNAVKDKNYRDGNYWTYYSLTDLGKLFPQFKRSQIATALTKLIKCKVLDVGTYNRTKYDRTRWFSLCDIKEYLEALKIIPKRPIVLKGADNILNIDVQNLNIDDRKTEHRMSENKTTIPDINTDLNFLSKTLSENPVVTVDNTITNSIDNRELLVKDKDKNKDIEELTAGLTSSAKKKEISCFNELLGIGKVYEEIILCARYLKKHGTLKGDPCDRIFYYLACGVYNKILDRALEMKRTGDINYKKIFETILRNNTRAPLPPNIILNDQEKELIENMGGRVTMGQMSEFNLKRALKIS